MVFCDTGGSFVTMETTLRRSVGRRDDWEGPTERRTNKVGRGDGEETLRKGLRLPIRVGEGGVD